MKVLNRALLLLALLLSACGGLELLPQPQSGQGWEFLAWAPSEYPEPAGSATVLISQVELDEVVDTFRLDFASPGELERVSQARTPNLSVDFETEVVLAIGSNAVGNCGGPVYLEISFTDKDVLVEPFSVPPDTVCTIAARRSVSLFALERSSLPPSPFEVVVFPQTENIINIDG